MKYIIMCGGNYRLWDKPRQLTEVKGEPIVARTIRLLRENGVQDIAVSCTNSLFEQFGVPLLVHDNQFTENKGVEKGYWVDAFYPMEEPACYIMGDVVFSDWAIKKIVSTETDDIEFFASSLPFSQFYPKNWAEPFAFKVVNQEHFRSAINTTKYFCRQGRFRRHPIAWELWQVIKKTKLNEIDYNNYTAINDYTCDVDKPEDVLDIERAMEDEGNSKLYIHTYGI